MKKLLVVLLIFKSFILFAEGDESINLTPLGEDLTTLLTGIGQDVVPLLHQNSVSGDAYGEAEIDEVFLPFYISIPTIGLSTTNGIATVLGDDAQEWKLEIAKIPNLIDTALAPETATTDGELTDTQKYFNLSQQMFGLPTVKLGFGVKLPKGLELHVSGIYLPPLDFGSFVPELANLSVDIMDIGIKVRKTIFSDKGFRPAFSIGARYFYSSFKFDYTFGSLTEILDKRLEVEGLGDMDLGGTFKINTAVQSFGLDFHLSKRLFLFTPFIKLSPTVYYSSMDTVAALKADIYKTGTDTSLTTTVLNSGGDVDGNGLALFASTGVEIRLFFFAIHLGVTADLQNPTFNLGSATSMDFEETAVDKLTLNLGFRIHF